MKIAKLKSLLSVTSISQKNNITGQALDTIFILLGR